MVEFRESTHQYYTGTGRELPSVTKILGMLGIYKSWYATEDHRFRGQAVHTACRLINTGQYSEAGTHPKIVPYARAFQQFVLETGYKSIGGEEPMGSAELGYAGTPDDWGWVGDELWLIDLKSGVAPGLVGLQLAAYRKLMQSAYPNLVISKMRALQLEKDGRMKVKPLFPDSNAHWGSLWQSCFNVYQIRKEHGLLPAL